MTDAHPVPPTVATIREHLPPPQKAPPVVLISLDELWARPSAEQLIAGILPANGLAVAYGEPKSGKSFVALDWSVSIAAARSWFGHAVKPGEVVYVVGEGAQEFGKRVKGASQVLDEAGYALMRQRLWVVEHPVHLLRDGVEHLRAAIEAKTVTPSLIVIDTVARSFSPGDENSAKDMSAYVTACDALRQRFGCTVLLVHHSAKGKLDLRGSSALRGAADTVIAVEHEDGQLTLSCEAQKDHAPFEPIRLRLQVVEIANDGGPGGTTCRVVAAAHVETIADPDAVPPSNKSPTVRDRVLDALASATGGLKAKEIEAATARSLGHIYGVLKVLEAEGKVERYLESGAYRLVEEPEP